MYAVYEWLKEAGLTLLLAVAALIAPPSPPSEGLRLSPCHLDGLAEQIECGVLEVFEDRASGAGRRIPIHVAVAPALGRHAAPDPLVVLAGGPGQGARGYVALADRFRPVRRSRDIVFVDLRGTGESAPLDCPGPSPDGIPLLVAGTAAEQARACLAALDADPRLYTHLNALADLADVLSALGYTRVNLWGGSWGTRAALVFAATYPDRVRTAVLDGAVPLSLPFPWMYPVGADAAFAALVRDCENDSACRATFPDPADDFARVMARVSAVPWTSPLRHPRTGRPVDVTLAPATMAEAIRVLLYSPQQAALVPAILSRAAAGDVAPLAAAAVQSAGWSWDTMALGATFAILCSEDVGVHADPGGAASARFRDGAVRFWTDGCAAWPRGPRLALASDVRVDAPALILSGALDPVTPPATGEAMRTHFPDSRHVVAAGAAHNVSFTGCVPELIAEFVARGAADGLDDTCVAAIARPPFALGTMGARP